MPATHPSRAKARKIKARVMYAQVDPGFSIIEPGSVLTMRSECDSVPEYASVAVIPCRTRAEARSWARLANMTPEEREQLLLVTFERQEKQSDEGREPGRIDLVRDYLRALRIHT